jgi:hypothetical protein
VQEGVDAVVHGGHEADEVARGHARVGDAQVGQRLEPAHHLAHQEQKLGGSVFTLVLAARLPAGPGAAFHAAFLWLSAASALGLLTALWLAAAERAPGAARSAAY